MSETKTTETTETKGKRGRPEGSIAAKYAPSTMRPFLVKMFGNLPDPAIEVLSKSPDVRKAWQASPEFAAWDADKDAKMHAARVQYWTDKVGKMGADERAALIAALAQTSDAMERSHALAEFTPAK